MSSIPGSASQSSDKTIAGSAIYKIAWRDTAGFPSRIHATRDGVDTLCGGHDLYLREREHIHVSRRRGGYSNFCRVCFKKLHHTRPWWDERSTL